MYVYAPVLVNGMEPAPAQKLSKKVWLRALSPREDVVQEEVQKRVDRPKPRSLQRSPPIAQSLCVVEEEDEGVEEAQASVAGDVVIAEMLVVVEVEHVIHGPIPVGDARAKGATPHCHCTTTKTSQTTTTATTPRALLHLLLLLLLLIVRLLVLVQVLLLLTALVLLSMLLLPLVLPAATTTSNIARTTASTTTATTATTILQLELLH